MFITTFTKARKWTKFSAKFSLNPLMLCLHCDVTLPSKPKSLFSFSTKILNASLLHAFYLPHPSQLLWFHESDKIWWRIQIVITYFPLIQHGPHRKRRHQQLFVATGTSSPSYYLETIKGYTDTRVQIFFYCNFYYLPLKSVYRAVA
jgi:hypothetical protein